ncbi:hypothetical protein Q7P35_006972 [Cladosporium inversicolor]
MFRLNSGSVDRKPSRTGSKSGIKAITSRLRPELRLAVDTDVSRHQGAVPEEVFPYETASRRRNAEQTASILSQRKRANPAGLRRELENRDTIQPGLVRNDSVSSRVKPSYPGLPPRPDVNKNPRITDGLETGKTLAAPALHNRVKGLRPSPLTLVDVSPSDRAIPIGIAVSSTAVSTHTTSPLTATLQTYSPPQQGHEAVTPTIIVTPAREVFELTPPTYLSAESQNHRIASSIYSRYTNCAPRTAEFTATPPVPPLPLFAQQPRKQNVKESKLPTYEECNSVVSHKATLSVCTVFEEDEHLQPPTSARSFSGYKIRSLKRQSTLPTPRRSRGWWNVITSPFSARSNGLFWRSPTEETLDRTAILGDASTMGVAEVCRRDLKEDVEDIEPRSAPATQLCAVPGSESRSAPKRSITAPGALDPNADVMNIYRIPSQGEAAAYYDHARHFPSLLVVPMDVPRSMFEDDSPLTDVCACEHHRHGNTSDWSVTTAAEDSKHLSTCSKSDQSTTDGGAMITGGLKSPFDDSHAIGNQHDSPEPPQRAMFTSPTADELLSPSPVPATPNRDFPRASIETLTPVIENAHVGTMVGPRSSNGEQRAVIIPPSRAPSPPNSTQEATVVARSPSPDRKVYDPVVTVMALDNRPPMHRREESRGLGISSGDEDLYPPPTMLSEKPRLATDRFGQLRIATEVVQRPPGQPWYRRFFCLIATACMFLVLLLIILLIMLVPQDHADNQVQAQWLNLTGFPPLPTGVATVIQPKNSLEGNKCINPPGLWSCSMPQTQLLSRNKSSRTDLPNFRFEIRFRNHTLENTTALMPATNYSSSSGPASVKSQLRARSTWSQILYSPNPAPPSEADQLALGSTTDNTTIGEETPFYISLLSPEPLPHLNKRDATEEDHQETPTKIPNPYPYPRPSNTTTYKNLTTTTTSKPIPAPLLLPNYHPQTPLLYPYATAQPLRLYNRGQEDEHYGFYTYFSKTALIADAASQSSSSSSASWVVSGPGAGSASSWFEDKAAKAQAGTSRPADIANMTTTASATPTSKAFCEFRQTRFRVQIWTRRAFISTLPAAGMDISSSDGPTARIQAGESSANDMQAPGSFPYGVTISLDRESGPDGDEGKGVFCWALDWDGRVVGEGRRIGERDVGAEVEVDKRDDDVRMEMEKRDEDGGCGCRWES